MATNVYSYRFPLSGKEFHHLLHEPAAGFIRRRKARYECRVQYKKLNEETKMHAPHLLISGDTSNVQRMARIIDEYLAFSAKLRRYANHFRNLILNEGDLYNDNDEHVQDEFTVAPNKNGRGVALPRPTLEQVWDEMAEDDEKRRLRDAVPVTPEPPPVDCPLPDDRFISDSSPISDFGPDELMCLFRERLAWRVRRMGQSWESRGPELKAMIDRGEDKNFVIPTGRGFGIGPGRKFIRL